MDASQGPVLNLSPLQCKVPSKVSVLWQAGPFSARNNMAKLSKAEQELLDSMDKQREFAAGRKKV